MKYSIIIPTYNKFNEALKPCLESILKYTDFSKNDVEIVIVANGCTDETITYIHSLNNPCITLLVFDTPIGYTAAINEGLKIAKGKYIVLLNNDTELLEQEKNTWLCILEKPFIVNDKTGVTGPMRSFSESANRHFLIFFCVMIAREIIEKIGDLDLCFSPGYGEDVDYCCRAEDRGYEVTQVPITSAIFYEDKKMTGDFPIYHKGNVTFKNWVDGDKLLERNNNILKERYKEIEINISKALVTDGYMSEIELNWLASKATTNKLIIEIGSWHGRSSRAIGDNLSSGSKLYCIDHWDGSANERETSHSSARLSGGDHAFIEFLNNMQDLIQKGSVVPLRMSSENAANVFKHLDIKADMIFIDAGHTYEEVKKDIEIWSPLLKEGGLICGHDYYQNNTVWPGVKKAVDELLPDTDVVERASIWYKENVSKKSFVIKERGQKIFDCFPFFNELDILEIRLEELYNTVDRFIISEATKTHGGKDKPLNFHNNLKRFEKYLNKITYLVVENYPATDSWSIERHQRDFLSKGLGGCEDNDIIMISDVDEIPRASSIKEYSTSKGISCLSQNLYYYYLNCRAKQQWDWLRILPYSIMKTMTPCQARYTIVDKKNMIENAGWHFSYMGGVDKVIEKMHSSAHQEYNTPYFTDSEKVSFAMENAKDLFERNIEYEYVNIDSSYPKFIFDNVELMRENKLIK